MVTMSAIDVSTRCSTRICPTRTWGSSGHGTSFDESAAASSRRRSALTSVASSSGVTPASIVTRSMPRALSRTNSSPRVEVPRGAGMSPTTTSSPTSAIDSEALSSSSRPTTSPNAEMLRMTSGWPGA